MKIATSPLSHKPPVKPFAQWSELTQRVDKIVEPDLFPALNRFALDAARSFIDGNVEQARASWAKMSATHGRMRLVFADFGIVIPE